MFRFCKSKNEFKLSDNNPQSGYQYLQKVLNRTREAFFLLDTAGNIRIYNEGAHKTMLHFTGVDLNSVTNLLDAIPEWRKETVRNAIVHSANNELVEYEVCYPPGKWLQVAFFPVYENGSAIEEILCIIRDATEKKKKEEEIRKSELLHRSLVETMAEGVVFHSADGTSHMANESAAAILRISKEELMRFGMSIPGLQWVDQKGQPVSIGRYTCAGNHKPRSVRSLVLGVKKEGEELPFAWLMLNTEPVRRQQGRADGCVITFTDVTEKLRTREELNLLSSVIRETSNLVVITDPEERITWANESFLKTSGYDLAEVTGRKPGEMLRGPAKNREEVNKIKAALRKGEAVSGEILNYTKQGTSFWASYNIHPVKDEEGKVIRFFSIQSDITELKAIREKMMEQQLAHQEQLAQAALEAQEKKQTEIGQELHDNVNQILAATKMYLGPIIKGEPNVRENATAVNSYIQLAIEEIRKLSHQLVTPRFRERSLRDVFEGLARHLGKEVCTDLRIEGIDETQLAQEKKLVLYRIAQEQINNIGKYANCSRVQIGLKTEHDKVIMMIEDNGKGFDPAKKTRGIGISNIYSRAEAMNGAVRIDTQPGNGCKLWVALPLSG